MCSVKIINFQCPPNTLGTEKWRPAHWVHVNFILSVWASVCLFRWPDWSKAFLHWVQANCFCLFRVPDWVKNMLHLMQENLICSVRVILWVLRLPERLKLLSQTVQVQRCLISSAEAEIFFLLWGELSFISKGGLGYSDGRDYNWNDNWGPNMFSLSVIEDK